MDSWSIASTNEDELIHQANVHILTVIQASADRGWISTAWAAAKVLLFQRFFSTLPSYSVHSLTQAAALDVLTTVHCTTSCAFSKRSSYDINCSIVIPKTIKTSLLSYSSSTAQGGGGSFKNRKPIGEAGCCESGMAERIHWWTERCLRSPTLALFFSDYLPTYPSIFNVSIYLSIYLWSLSLSLSFI